MKSAIQSCNVNRCLQVMEEKLQQLETSPINVAIIGNVATGKSSFVNAIRGLSADDENAAPVGEFQSVSEVREYLHPTVPQLKFWDLPGVGGMHFPKKSYLEDVCFDRYDFFILITAGRFTETDGWLGEEIQKCDKKYFFVRTHIDKDISNDRKAHPSSHNEEELIQSIHQYTAEELEAHGSSHVPVFLISNYDRTKYDFGRIEQQLIEDLPEIRKNAIILCKISATKDMIQAASQGLFWRLWVYSALLAAAASVPNYFVSTALSAALAWYWNRSCFYRFGLDRVTLKRYARITSINLRKVEEIFSKNFEGRKNKMKRMGVMVIGVLGMPAISVLMGPSILHRVISAAAAFVSARLLIGFVMNISKKAAVMTADDCLSEIRNESQP